MRRILALIALGSALVLVGCRPADGPKSLEPPPPVFESREAAVEAAVETLVAYIAAGNRMAQSGGTDLSGFDGLVSENQLEDDKADAEKLQREGERLVGDLTTFGFDVKGYYELREQAALHAQFCVDLTGTTVVDRDGKDLSAESHRPSAPYEIFFRTYGREPRFIVKEVERWVGVDFCLAD